MNIANLENMNRVFKIPTFCSSQGESAKFWLAKFEQVMKMKKVSNEDKTIQLFLLLEGKAEMWYHTLSEDIQGTYNNLRGGMTVAKMFSNPQRLSLARSINKVSIPSKTVVVIKVKIKNSESRNLSLVQPVTSLASKHCVMGACSLSEVKMVLFMSNF